MPRRCRGISLPPSTLRVATSATLRRTTQCAPQGYLLRGEHWAASQREAGRRGTDSHASDVGHWLGMTPLRGVFGRTGSSAPTEQRKGCGGETAGRCTPRVLVPLRGHRPLRNDRRKPVCRGGALPRPMAFRSPFFASDGILSFLGERKYPKNAIQGGRDFDFPSPLKIPQP